ncbi:MAG: Spy0128 family protein, partial [Bilifractor sp.]
VVVKVTDNGDGTLSAAVVDNDSDTVAFTNTYTASGSITLTGTKTLTGRTLKSNEFHFTVKEGDEVVSTGSNAAPEDGSKDNTGVISFSPIQYTQDNVGEHIYTVTEDATTLGGIAPNTQSFTVVVNVTDNGDGSLKAEVVSDSSQSIAFTNTYTANGEAVLTASKSLVGKKLEANAYSFDLKDEDGNILQTKKNAADGKVTFDPITYSLDDLKDAGEKGKTYTYTISEVLPEGVSASNPTKDGITYDTSVKTVKVNVADNGDGTLRVTYGDNKEATFAGANFTNTYATAGQAQFYATKTLSGKTLEAGEFSFALKDGEGKVLQTKSNDANGHVAFDAITYSLDDAGKTYTYTISEVLPKGVSADNPTKDGITYDTSEQTVNVKVIDNGDGTLKVTYDGQDTFTGKTFANSYAAEGQAQLSAKKTLEGRTLTAGAYQFVLKEGNTAIETVSNDKDGNVTFSPIQYTAAGDHTYTISEVLPEGVSAENPTKDGITYDTHVETVTVHVKDNGKGKLDVTYGDDNAKAFAGANFTNSYAASGEAVLTASKSLEGKTLEAGAYSFELKDSDGKVLQTKKNAADGKVTFDPITYALDDLKDAGEKGKTYTYTISEVLPEGVSASNPTKDGITYDTSVKTVKVNVADNGNGTLNVTYGDNKDTTFAGASFTNTYAADGQAQFYATKTLSGRTMEAGEFSFALKDGDGKVLQTKSNDANGHVSFDAIRYTKEDAGKTYTYKISEVLPEGVTAQNPTKDGFTYDTSEQTVKVKVTDNGDGTLKVTYDGKDTFTGKTFANSYAAEGSAQLSARKSLNGKTLTEGAFSFELKEGNNLIQKASNDKDGNVQFDAIRYTAAGDHTYTISEVLPEGVSASNPTKDGITYDTHVETVIVHVTDNGKGKLDVTYGDNKDAAFAGADFTNTYEAQMASATISGTKLLNSGDAAVKAGQFRFDLYDANGNRVDTATNDENGNYIFGRLHFKKAGNYTYTIREQNAGQTIGGIKYQDEAKTVTISVTDDGYGTLTANDAVVSAFDNTQYGTIKVQKDWDDSGNESYRPSTVEIELIDADTREVVQTLELSELNNWTASFDGLVAGKAYTVHEVENSEYYQAEGNDQTAVADVNGKGVVELTNKFTHPAVTIYANKVLNGGTLTNGEFTFELYRNSDPDTVYKTATNNVAGEIFFTDVEYDEKGYTVKEVKGDDPSISYDEGAIVYDAEGNVTSSSHTEFTNTQRPIVLRVQKRSKVAPYDPLVGATYGLYEVVSGGNDVLVESQVSDDNGYMYYGQIEPSTDAEQHIYYFKEIAAPEGHEVDPYAGTKFQVRYTDNGEIALFGEDGKTSVTIGDITSQDQNKLLVQRTSEKTALDTDAALTYEDDTIKAVAQAEDGAFEDGTTMKVTQLTGSALKDAQNKVEASCGKIAANVVYYDVQFVDKNGVVVEPKFGDVTVTIQYKDSLKLPEGTDADALKIVHLKDNGDAIEVQAVAGSIAENSGKLLQTSFTSDSFSTFGIVQPSADNSSLNSNYLVTAAGVADQVSRLNIAKLDTSGKYVKGAELQIIDKATGNVMADWKTTDGPQKFARWFDDAKTKSMNVETYYILHEVSAPDGYQLADDILFKINKYDSSITIYKQDANGNLVADQEAIDKWVSDKTLEMIDVPVEVQVKTIPKQKVIRNEKVIQGKDKVVYVTNVKAVKTGDTSAIAMYLVILAIAGAALVLLFRARRAKKNR